MADGYAAALRRGRTVRNHRACDTRDGPGEPASSPAPDGGGNLLAHFAEGPRGLLYTGVSTDVARRLREHASGVRGARFFRFGKPMGLRYVETATDRASAQRREAAIKRLPRLAKLALIASYLARP